LGSWKGIEIVEFLSEDQLMSTFQITMVIIIWVAFSAIVGAVASQRGRNGVIFGLASLVLSPLLVLFILVAIPVQVKVENNKTPCPHCHGLVDRDVSCCMHCGRAIKWPVPEPKYTPAISPPPPPSDKTLSITSCGVCGKMFRYADYNSETVSCTHCGSEKIIRKKETKPEQYKAECPDCGKSFPFRPNVCTVEELCPHCQSILKLDTAVAVG
jgi:DNA-directed RNA polymerase subunit RPC12/RpoP